MVIPEASEDTNKWVERERERGSERGNDERIERKKWENERKCNDRKEREVSVGYADVAVGEWLEVD